MDAAAAQYFKLFDMQIDSARHPRIASLVRDLKNNSGNDVNAFKDALLGLEGAHAIAPIILLPCLNVPRKVEFEMGGGMVAHAQLPAHSRHASQLPYVHQSFPPVTVLPIPLPGLRFPGFFNTALGTCRPGSKDEDAKKGRPNDDDA